MVQRLEDTKYNKGINLSQLDLLNLHDAKYNLYKYMYRN